jgi:hypothetical protein
MREEHEAVLGGPGDDGGERHGVFELPGAPSLFRRALLARYKNRAAGG